jgi:hypothetical protein
MTTRCSTLQAYAKLVAGAIESLSAMAHAHLELGVASPFLVCYEIPVTFRYGTNACIVHTASPYPSVFGVSQEGTVIGR